MLSTMRVAVRLKGINLLFSLATLRVNVKLRLGDFSWDPLD